ncbi:LysR substrate-binding domain-containing protein [Comamonas resistens]|uniref:LysR substrate-binding domain-containing protein n=1 Tax=Comamonas resistens TaxID=3046670 RepID=A0ABY8SRX2_9BURK|nr:LysR substrate-binding domain-containing protein [Comamonas resistens]MDL5037013.1 LysR substrate-binding domain-containing protein [Comamonas resistens]WHS65782.1 LysR substrate-binding domain-containing protein [Comamonas resistens]
MQLKSLRMFEAVCESGSFGIAAQRLHTVQSNVTAHIKKLEDEVGAQLLVRANPVFPTPAGHTLLQYARQMLQSHDHALALLQSPQFALGPITGVLRIGSMETTAALRLPPLLARLRQQHPGIDLELAVSPTASQLDELRAGRIDCAFINGAAPQSDLHSWPVFREELVLVSNKPLKQFPSADDFCASVFLAFRQGCSYRQRIELLMASMGISAVRIMELGMLDTILGCVAAGMGYALLSRSLVEAQQQRFDVHWMTLPGKTGRELAWVDTCFVSGALEGWSPAVHAFAKVLGVDPQSRESRPVPLAMAA